MGCDIHMVLEKNFQGKWVGLHAYPYVSKKGLSIYGEDYDEKKKIHVGGFVATDRNYKLFGALAKVRHDSPFGHEPMGVPSDASDLTMMSIEAWGRDGHSHSYMLLPEFLRCYAYAHDDAAYDKGCVSAIAGEELPFKEFAEEVTGISYWDDSGEKPTDYRIVFWFDN